MESGIHKIKHVIIIMQENRSFDNYFGTYPGVDGIPMKNGVPTVCIPNPKGPGQRPYHDTADFNGGGPHGLANAIADINGGKMNGFIGQRDTARGRSQCKVITDPACSQSATPDVMGYHTGAEIPNYWAYAKNFVLADRMFEAVKSWSLPEHLFMVSAWSARCKNRDPTSCHTNITGPYNSVQMQRAVHQELTTGTTSIDMAWTDVTWLLHMDHVSWAYFVQRGTQPGLRQRLRAHLPRGQASPHDPRHLEPTAALHRRAGRRPDTATSRDCPRTLPTPRPAPCPRSPGSPHPMPTASIPRPASTRARPT